MKYGLLITSPISDCKNIGDYIQSLAAKQFLNDDYYYVEKESISEFEVSEPIKMIMNAWYMWHPECWPPKSCIRPLLTSMHITYLNAKEMLDNGGKEYLINNGPVGCRDLDTKRILDKEGIPCYFSACLTLTLGNTYKYKVERKGFVFVDPFIPPVRYVIDGKSIFFPNNIIKAVRTLLRHPRKIMQFVKHYDFFKMRYKLLSYYNAAMFYRFYSTLFDDELLFSADYITHMVSVNANDNNDTLLQKAEGLVKKYAKSRLVITSRIHCGLPCLGLETPVLFILNEDMESKKNMFNAPGRFGGLIDFFNVVDFVDDRLIPKDKSICVNGKISCETNIVNNNKWENYRDKLNDICHKFING